MYPHTLYVKEVRVPSTPPSPPNANRILPKFTMDKTKCRVKIILKEELGKHLGSNVSNKVKKRPLRKRSCSTPSPQDESYADPLETLP